METTNGNAAAAADPSLPPPKGTILLVEDHASIRALASLTLTQEGYTVVEARNGRDAVQRSLEFAAAIHLLVTDINMPLVNGLELVRSILPLRPGMKVTFITGRDKNDVPGGVDISILEKPFTMKGLLAHVRQILA